MADANANIRIDVDTSDALAQIKSLQRQISIFHTSMAQGGKAAAAQSAKMQANLVNSINATKGFSAQMTTISTSTESFTNSLEKNKFSMGQYFRYAGASTKTFGKLFKTEFETIGKVARERTKDLQTQYIKMGRDANGAMKAIKVRPTTLDLKNLGTQTAIAAQKQQLFNQLVKQGSTNLLNWGKNTQWAGRQLMVGFTIPLTIMGATASREFMKLEEQAIRFRRVYGDMFTTNKETRQALADVRELSKEFTKFGVSVEDTIDLAASVAQMGAMGADLTNQVTQATRLAVLGGIEQQEALDTTISLTNAFGLATDQLAGKIAFLNAAENQTILSIEDFNEAIPKAGSVVNQLGGSVEDLAYFLTAMREGGINASQSANALKSSLARLINPTEVAVQKMSGFGIDILGIVDENAGNLRGTIQVLAKELDKLDPLDKARAVEQLFGKFQFARMSTLFENIVKDGSQANKVLQLTTNSAEELAIIADRELNRVSESPMYKFKKAIEEFQASLAPLGEAFLKLATPVIEFGNRVLDQFNNLSDGTKQFITGAVAIGGVVAPALIMVVGLIANAIANTIKFGLMIKTALSGAANSSGMLTDQYQYMNQEQIEAAAVAASLDQVHAKLRQTFTAEAAAVDKLTAAYDRSIAKQRQMAMASGGKMGPGAGRAPKKYNDGVLSVPGPKGAGDIVPAMLAPGEAVIPARMAEKYSPLIDSMISGNIPGYKDGVNFSHFGASQRMTAAEAAQMNLPGTTADFVRDLATAAPDAELRAIGSYGFKGDARLNRQAARSGADSGAYIKDFQSRSTSSRLQESIGFGGGDVNDANMMKDFEAYDKDLQERMIKARKDGAEKFVDTRDDLARIRKKEGKNFDPKKYGVLEDLEAEAAEAKLKNTKAGQVREKARGRIRDVRWNTNKELNDRLSKSAPGRRVLDRITRKSGSKQGVLRGSINRVLPGSSKVQLPLDPETERVRRTKNYNDGLSQSAKTASESKRTKKIAKDTVDGYANELERGKKKVRANAKKHTQAQLRAEEEAANRSAAARKGWETRRANANSAAAAASRRSMGERFRGMGGRMAGVGAAASSAAMMGSMIPGKAGETASKLIMPLMGLSMVLPMLTNGIGIAVVALGLLAAGGYAVVSSFGKARDEAMEMAYAMGAGTDAIESLAEASGNVSAGQIMDRRRENEGELFNVAPGKSTFGETFMEGDAGTALRDNVTKALKAGDMQQVQAMVTNQMATAVASGALQPGQARSIVAELASEIGDYGFGIDINAKLIELLGPNGENLVNDPLGVRVKLIEETTNQLSALGAMGQGANSKATAVAGVTAANATMGAVGGAAGKKAIQQAGTKLADVAKKKILTRIGAGLAMGSVAGPVGSAIGTIVGVATAAPAMYDAMKGLGTASGAVVASGAIALQQQQELLDSLQVDYETRIASAKAAGDAAEATRLENEYLVQRQGLMQAGAATMEGLVSGYDEAGMFGKFGLDRAADKALKDLYKDNPLQQAVLDGVVDQVKDVTSGEQEYQLKLSLLSKDLSPAELSSFLNTFGKDQETIETFLDIQTNLGNAEGSRALRVMNLFDTPERQSKFLANIDVNKPKEADDYISFFQDVAKTGNVTNLDAILNFYQDNPAAATKLMQDIDKIEEIAADGPKELIAYQTVLGEEEMEALLKYNEDFNSLSKDNQIMYIQTFKTIHATEGTPEFQQGKRAAETETGESMTNDEYSAYNAERVVASSAGMSVPDAPETTTTTGGSGSGPKASVFDELTKSLRDTRSASIEAEKGWDAATDSLDDLFEGGKKGIKVFDGLANQMRGLGASEGMIEKIVGMDPDEYEKRKDELFNFDPDGRITSVTNKFKSLQAAMNSKELGDYVNNQEGYIANTNHQFTAMNKLTSSGMSFVDAYEMVQDQALATAIAMSASTAEMEELIEVTERMNAMQEKMDKEAEKSQAAEAVKRTNKEFEERYKALGKIAKEQDKLSDTQISEILSDPNLTKLYLNPSIDPGTLQKRLQQAEAKANLELRLKISTEEGKEEIFDEAMGDIRDQFSRKEEEIDVNFRLATEDDSDVVRDAQNKIAAIQFEIDDYQAELKGIADQEDEINDRYDKRYEALEKVADSQEKIARAQKAQLDVADALSRGDIAAAARAQQELQQQEAEAAREEQRAQLERAQEAELKNLRSASGLSREQLEDNIKDKKDEIFKIEEDELEPAQERIRLAEYEKTVALDNLKIAGRTRDEWDKIANSVDLATVNADEFAKSIERALALYEYFVNGKPLDASLFGDKELQELIDSGQVDAGDVIQEEDLTVEDVLTPDIIRGINDGTVDEEKLTKTQIAAKELYEAINAKDNPETASQYTLSIAKKAGVVSEDGRLRVPADVAERMMKQALVKEQQEKSLAFSKAVGTTNPDRLDRAYNTALSSQGVSSNVGSKSPAQIANNNSTEARRDQAMANRAPAKPAPKPPPPPVYTPKPSSSYIASYNRPVYKPSVTKAPTTSTEFFNMRAAMRSSGGSIPGYSVGGNVKGYSFGGFANSMGSDNVPAMLTPGEFVIRRPAVQSIGMDKLEGLNKTGTYSDGSVYNYNLAVNVSSMSDPDKIARTVMKEIRRVESQRMRGSRI